MKVLFLAMSCNETLYKYEVEAEKNTWAKDIIAGKYDGYDYYAFTGLDAEHTTECIENNIIYCAVPDDLVHTYQKTRRALQILKENGKDYDFVVRTNTATFINIPKFVNEMNYGYFPEDMLSGNICHQWNITENRYVFDIIGGNFMILPRWAVEIILEQDVNEQNMHLFKEDNLLVPVDDFLICTVINYHRPELKNTYKEIELSRYKTDLMNYSIQSQLRPYDALNIYFDREMINDRLWTQLKICNTRHEFRFLEIQHMHELQEEIEKRNR